ncbi:MAG: DUF1824 family protein [Oscillatoria sp. PMC 1068.18]|nr:DUF1824 family protein [Oscillatoria sp. PMC 1076.18]MEC4991011.1 DUF1824 family protein [Oscillatoria sp. PMC 1068.18]
MSTENDLGFTVEEARKILDKFSCTEVKEVESAVEKKQLRQALLLITGLSESENLGVCADNSQQAFAALSSYLQAMDYRVNFDLASITPVEKPVYLKYNTQKKAYYLDSYTGKYRGVLVSCQSEDDDVNGVYGHLPLNLFSE